MTMARSESNSKPILSAGDLHLVTVYDSSMCSSFPPIFCHYRTTYFESKSVSFSFSYGRIYCLQVDREAMLLHLYRFYRDAVVQQVSLLFLSS